MNYLFQNHKNNLLRALIPAGTGADATETYGAVKRERREQQDALEALKIRVNDRATVEVERLTNMLRNLEGK